MLGDVQHVRLCAYILVDFWYQSRSLGHIGHDQCWDDLASCFHGTQRILGMLSQNMKRYILLKPIGSEILSSRNTSFIRIFVPEADGCVDLQGDLLVYLFDSKSPPSGRLSLIASVFLYQNLGASSNESSSYPWEDLKTERDLL
ncbi:LOW QUALITY PROTEIN: hypothetical protein HID58_055408, partial [Brassica napus]